MTHEGLYAIKQRNQKLEERDFNMTILLDIF